MKISVVVPVYNQEKIISKIADALFAQDISAKIYEIIVIDDGSTDGTMVTLQTIKKGAKVKFSIFKNIKKHGRGTARNLGIKKASNEIIVLLDGDIVATKNLLSEHLKWHKKFPKENFAMVGHITWSPEIEVKPFMYWLEHGGQLVAFDDLRADEEIDHRHFYTGNTSLKKKFLFKNGLFNEDFGRNIYEDLELAYRLRKKGLRIFYNRDALGYHYHSFDPKTWSKRMVKVGKGAKILFEKHPELKDKIAFSKYTLRTILNQLFSPIYFFIGKVINSPQWMGYYYNARFFRKYMKGYKGK